MDNPTEDAIQEALKAANKVIQIGINTIVPIKILAAAYTTLMVRCSAQNERMEWMAHDTLEFKDRAEAAEKRAEELEALITARANKCIYCGDSEARTQRLESKIKELEAKLRIVLDETELVAEDLEQGYNDTALARVLRIFDRLGG